MRKILKLTALTPFLALTLLASSMAQAGAVGAQAGVITGNVTVAPGISLTPTNTTYTFLSTTIRGALVDAKVLNTRPQAALFACQGLFRTLGVRGSARNETTAGAVGNVNSRLAPGRIAGPANCLTGLLYGIFLLVGTQALLDLVVCFFSIAIIVVDGIIIIVIMWICFLVLFVAEFLPTNPTLLPVTRATFAGVFAGADPSIL